jgi:hypothetical protein
VSPSIQQRKFGKNYKKKSSSFFLEFEIELKQKKKENGTFFIKINQSINQPSNQSINQSVDCKVNTIRKKSDFSFHDRKIYRWSKCSLEKFIFYWLVTSAHSLIEIGRNFIGDFSGSWI